MCNISAFECNGVSGFLHQPGAASCGALALTHGAGSDCNARLLVALAEAFCARNWTVLRYNLAFRRNRPFGPPLPAYAAADQTSVKNAVAELRKLTGGTVVAAGHSYGGRQTTMLAAEEPALCEALIAFSYPLHPPKKPEQLRTAHFPSLRIPVLFAQGSVDGFGTVAEMQNAMQMIPGPARLAVVQGAGHDLKSGKFNIDGLVIRELDAMLSDHCSHPPPSAL